MPTPTSNPISFLQDQYLTLAKQSQEAAATVAGAWVRSLQQISVTAPSAAGQAATAKALDQMYDFAVKVIDVQRNLNKQILSQSATVVEDVAQTATTVVNETTQKVARASRRSTKAGAGASNP